MKENLRLVDKVTLTIEEAAVYSNIGINKLRELLRKPDCPFALRIGRRTLVKRKPFEEFIEMSCAI